MKERIIRIMKEKDMNASQFSDAIGIQRATISHILAGRNNPSLDMVTKILTKFPAINPDWLISGVEPMKRTSGNSDKYSGSPDLFPPSVYPEKEMNQANDAKKNLAPPPALHPENPISSHQEIRFTDVTHQESDVYNSKNETKEVIKETIIYKERPNKTIDKILIFYSDSTYETFIPEKHEVSGS